MLGKVLNGFYDFDKKRIIEKDEKIEVETKRGQELIALGLLEEIKQKKAPAKTTKKAE